MSPIDRMERFMDGLSWDEAEDVGVEVLAKVLALHVYARKEGREYYRHLMERICKRADEWAHEGDHPFVLAMAAVGNRIEKSIEDKTLS